MKTLLVAINAQYIHTNLAVRYLCRYQDLDKSQDVSFAEFTINQLPEQIFRRIYEQNPDLLCFSCYLWNIRTVLQLADDYKQLRPEAKILLGGPEVSYDGEALLRDHPAVDFIIAGEGEKVLRPLLDCLSSAVGEKDLSSVPGLVYRGKAGQPISNPRPAPMELGQLPFPYEGELDELKNRLVYYETSRGCPFNCRYCLSSAEHGVRFQPLEKVFRELQYFLDARVRQVKLVDRTFNCKRSHYRPILQYLLERDNGITNFHLEVSADLLEEEDLALLSRARPGLFQLEIGVQTTHPETAAAVDRLAPFERIAHAVEQIHRFRNIHCHLDLIAGLPQEGYADFARSFDDVFSLRPEQLQLGFLKLLKGSYLREHAAALGLKFCSAPPYEVLASDKLSFGELSRLKGIEEMVEIYYNSGRFEQTLVFLLDSWSASAAPRPSIFLKRWRIFGRIQDIRTPPRDISSCARSYGIFTGMRTGSTALRLSLQKRESFFFAMQCCMICAAIESPTIFPSGWESALPWLVRRKYSAFTDSRKTLQDIFPSMSAGSPADCQACPPGAVLAAGRGGVGLCPF